MLEVNPNKEILKIKTSYMGVGIWQGIWMILGVVAGSLVYYMLPFPSIIKAPCIVPVVIVFGAIGFVDIHGMNLFQVIQAMIHTAKLSRHPLILLNEKGEYDVSQLDNEK